MEGRAKPQGYSLNKSVLELPEALTSSNHSSISKQETQINNLPSANTARRCIARGRTMPCTHDYNEVIEIVLKKMVVAPVRQQTTNPRLNFSVAVCEERILNEKVRCCAERSFVFSANHSVLFETVFSDSASLCSCVV